MVALVSWFAFLSLRWVDSRRASWAIAMGATGGLTVFVKPVAGFVVAGILVASAIAGRGVGPAVRDRMTWVAGLLVAVPSLVFMTAVPASGGNLSQIGTRFVPSLLVEPAFYRLWFFHVVQVVSLFVFMALAGTILTRDRQARCVLLGWWVGYLAYSLAFAFHTATHDYYQLPLVPLVAVATAPLAAAAISRLRAAWPVNADATVAALIGLPLVAVVAVALLNGGPALAQPEEPPTSVWAELRQRLSLDSQGSRSVVSLTHDYGLAAAYFGWFAATSWPSGNDIEYRRLTGSPETPFATRFTEIAAGRDYFVVTWLDELARQRDLQEYLDSTFPVVARSPYYVAYDLRHPMA